MGDCSSSPVPPPPAAQADEAKRAEQKKNKEERLRQRKAQALLLAKAAAEADQAQEGGDEDEIENIVDVKKGPLGLVYEIKWKGYERPEDNTWEPEANLHPELVTDFKRDYPELVQQVGVRKLVKGLVALLAERVDLLVWDEFGHLVHGSQAPACPPVRGYPGPVPAHRDLHDRGLHSRQAVGGPSAKPRHDAAGALRRLAHALLRLVERRP